MNATSTTAPRIAPFHLLTAFVCLSLVCLNIARICNVPLTVDESPSRSDLLLSYWDYISLQKVTANIHILNSILRKASIETFGNTPFFLRLPSLIAQILFLFYLVRLLVQLFGRSIATLLIFVAINVNPFLFEFWCYSRGYALAVSCMIASVFYYCMYTRDGERKHVYASLGFAVLSVWANFSLLNFYLALILAFVLSRFLTGAAGKRPGNLYIPLIAATTLLTLLAGIPILKLRTSGELYYGGDTGLIQDTITSLARESLYTPFSDTPEVQAAIAIGIALNLASILYYTVAGIRRRLTVAHHVGLSICLMLNLILASLWMQHQLFSTKYLIDRTAIFILPLFYLNAACFIVRASGNRSIVTSSLLGIFAVLGTVKFANSMTVHKSRAWWMDNYNVQVLERLAPLASSYGRPLRLRVAWIQMPSMDYYVYTRYPTAFEPLDYDKNPPGAADTGYDYCYLPRFDTMSISKVYRVDTVYDGNFVLFRKAP